MNKKGRLASKTAFYMAYALLFALTITYALSFMEDNESRLIDFTEMEKSVLVNRAISCLSKDSFGEIKMEDFNEEVLGKCFNHNDMNFQFTLDNGGIGENPTVLLGEGSRRDSIRVDRMILVDGVNTELIFLYKKNVE